ncbi:SDR family oxidoreductase [Timonella sp. A28]|uniref:SDR family oxidoreductase n=1 Tax=Timonella sp. A28 TaxID=3442640 RepID=UPI003EBE7A61
MTEPTGAEPQLCALVQEDGSTPTVLVLGSTGFIGGRLVPRLLNAGYTVRVLVRNASRIKAFTWGNHPALDVIEGDAEALNDVKDAARDTTVIYHLVHSMTGGADFAARDRRIAHNVATAGNGAGTARVIYLSGLHPATGPLSQHLESRREVGDILTQHGPPALIFQAGVVIGSGSASFEMVRHLTEVLPVMPAPKWVNNLIQPIAIRDILYYLLAAARLPEHVHGTYDIGGPDILSYANMMNGYAKEAGLPKRTIMALPVLTPKLASLWVNLVTPIPRSIARPLVESLQHDCVMRNHNIDDIISPPPGGLLDYTQSVRLAIKRLGINQVETSWQDARVATAPSDPLPSDPNWAGTTVYTDTRSKKCDATVEDLWTVITAIGGTNGWYSTPGLWAIRGWIDKIAGGVGLRRGRRNTTTLRPGDAVDFWRVEVIQEQHLLRLRAEMKVPGKAWLELMCAPTNDGSIYRQRAIYFPRGLSGRLYWWAVYPFHGFVFSGMQNRIVALAERNAHDRRLNEQYVAGED